MHDYYMAGCLACCSGSLCSVTQRMEIDVFDIFFDVTVSADENIKSVTLLSPKSEIRGEGVRKRENDG